MLSRIRTKKIHPENFIFQESHLFSNRRKWNKIVFFHIFVSSTGKHHLLLFGVVCGSCNTLAYIFYSIRYTCKGNKCKVSTNPFHFQFLCHLDGNDDFLCFLCSSVSSFLSYAHCFKEYMKRKCFCHAFISVVTETTCWIE